MTLFFVLLRILYIPIFQYITFASINMKNVNESPVTVSTEQAAAYAAESEYKKGNNVLTQKTMKENNIMEANENMPVYENQSSVEQQERNTSEGNRNSQSNPTLSVPPFDKCLCGTYITGTKAGTIPSNPNLKEWNGNSLQEQIIYHRNDMIGLPECTIIENRNAQIRAKQWQKTCRKNGMITPGVYTKAKIAKDAGLTPAIYLCNTKSWWLVPDDLLNQYYLRWDGNGRAAGHDLDLEEAMKDPNYTPFDFTFVYKKIDDPDLFFKQYISVNLDVKKTSRSELLSYSSCRNADSTLNNYYRMIGDGYVAKSSSYYNWGRELTKDDIKKASEGQDIIVEQDLVDGMGRLLETYKKVFSGNASVKVLKGVPLARWSCDTLKKANDRKAMADKISEKFSNMKPQQLTRLQDAKGIKGDRTNTTEIILTGIFNEILNN